MYAEGQAIYLDYAATAPLRPEVWTAMAEALDCCFNPASSHSFGQRAHHSLEEARAQLAGLMVELGGILGMFQADPEQWLKRSLRPGGPSNDDEQISDTEIEDLITARNQARQEKNWTESDRIRDELAAMSIQLEDGPDGTTWRRGI